ncbi:MAG: hypothetical protein ILA04_03060 [Prevotella sp.]|nr:hypothetical protein [Prevotella sp.]
MIHSFHMKKISLTLSILLILAACQESLEKRTEREAQEFTRRHCPTPVQNNQRTDSLTFDQSTKTMTYWYTLCGTADDADAVGRQEEELIETLRQGVRNYGYLSQQKKAGFNIRYVYHSQRRPEQVLLDVTFTKDDY